MVDHLKYPSCMDFDLFLKFSPLSNENVYQWGPIYCVFQPFGIINTASDSAKLMCELMNENSSIFRGELGLSNLCGTIFKIHTVCSLRKTIGDWLKRLIASRFFVITDKTVSEFWKRWGATPVSKNTVARTSCYPFTVVWDLCFFLCERGILFELCSIFLTVHTAKPIKNL